MTQEQTRLSESESRKKHWKRWGPYLSERAWVQSARVFAVETLEPELLDALPALSGVWNGSLTTARILRTCP
jgi:hypothetical protein